MTQSDITNLTERLLIFRDDREWRQFQTLKNLILSINLETAELLELAQWKSALEVEEMLGNSEFIECLSEECADVFLYLLMICERAKIDLVSVAKEKIKINETKYPVEMARGTAKKYNKF